MGVIKRGVIKREQLKKIKERGEKRRDREGSVPAPCIKRHHGERRNAGSLKVLGGVIGVCGGGVVVVVAVISLLFKPVLVWFHFNANILVKKHL